VHSISSSHQRVLIRSCSFNLFISLHPRDDLHPWQLSTLPLTVSRLPNLPIPLSVLDPTTMHTVIVFVTLIAAAAAQCTGSDHPRCKSWQRNGYCTNNGVETVKKYCGVTCGLCTTDGYQTALGGGNNMADCVDANA
ncbi:hypothetical protein PENTCL1PPCAC_1970, partial [Pristionchus entomophagus]